MSLHLKVFILSICLGFAYLNENKTEEIKSNILNKILFNIENKNETSNSTEVIKKLKNINPKRLVKRNIGLDYYTDYLEYAAYDYYDWVCSNGRCNLCDVLTGECCDPAAPPGSPEFVPNCFLPDSCANNPCLSGGTCIPTRTIDDRADFICSCKKGYTGKYCQLIDQFDPPLFAVPAPLGAPIGGPIGGPVGGHVGGHMGAPAPVGGYMNNHNGGYGSMGASGVAGPAPMGNSMRHPNFQVLPPQQNFNFPQIPFNAIPSNSPIMFSKQMQRIRPLSGSKIKKQKDEDEEFLLNR